MSKRKSSQVSQVDADDASSGAASRVPQRRIFRIGTAGAGTAAAALVSALALGCAAPAYEEPRGSATSKLLKAHATTSLPASNGADFASDQGGPTIDIDGWEGYVAGTTPSALFELDLSAIAGTKSAGGLAIAFASEPGTSGDLATQLASASRLEVRFRDGSGIVSSHDFGAGTTVAAHQADANADALLRRAYSDAEALLRLPVDQAGGGDKAATCMASFLAVVSASARCVDDAANTDDCAAVRNEAVLVAGSCNGPATANVLAGHGSIRTQALAGGGAGALGSIFKLLGSFALGGGKGGAGGAGGLGSFASILSGLGGLAGKGAGGAGGLGSFGGLLGGLLKGGGGGLLGGGKALTGGASGLGNIAGLGNNFDPGVFNGNAFDVSDFGNSDLSMGDFGDVIGDGLF